MKTLKSILALTLVVFLPFGLMIWIRNRESTGFAAMELITYPLLFGGLSILLLVALKKFFLREKLSDVNSGQGNWGSDLLWGVGLTIMYFILFFLFRVTLRNVLEFRSNPEMLGLMLSLRENIWLLLLWFGPVLWLGIALYEELIRVFLLSSFWKWSDQLLWSLFVILFSAALMGLVHWSQGSYGMVTIGIKGLVSGYFFFRKRRLMPLVYAHVLYDGLQVALLLLTYPEH